MADSRHPGARAADEDDATGLSASRGDDRAALVAKLAASLDAAVARNDPQLAEWRNEAQEYLRTCKTTRRRRLHSAAILCVAAVASLAVWQHINPHLPEAREQIVSAPADNMRTVRLSDGSMVLLDRRTRLSVIFSDHARTLRLQEGQARFIVHRDTDRPFRVIVGDREVRATGTDFNVIAAPDQFAASLIKGGVIVSRLKMASSWFKLFQNTEAQPLAELTAGQQFIEEKGRGMMVRRFRPEEVTAWQQGKLVLNKQTVASAAARFARYSGKDLIIVGPALRNATVSGVFATDDPIGFAETVGALFPDAKVEFQSDRILITDKRAQKNSRD